MFSSRFSIFGGGGSEKVSNRHSNGNSIDGVVRKEPILKLQTDKEVYRPGDSVLVTIEVVNPSDGRASTSSSSSFRHYSLLIERLGFDIKGIEKLDPQWFATLKPLPGSKQRRGEYVFMDFSASSLVSNQIISCGAAKTYVVRTMLPSIIPPSYRGSTIRYLYYMKCNLSGRWLIMENGISHGELTKEIIDLEIRSPLQIWVTQKNNGLLMEGQGDGIVPATTVQLDVFWKEMNGEEWVRANDVEDGAEEGYESSRDEVSSVSSYNPTKDTIHKAFGSSLSLQSTAARSSNKDGPFADGRRASLSSVSLPRLSIAEVLYDSRMDSSAPDKSSVIDSPSQEQKNMKLCTEDELAAVVGAGTSEPAT